MTDTVVGKIEQLTNYSSTGGRVIVVSAPTDDVQNKEATMKNRRRGDRRVSSTGGEHSIQELERLRKRVAELSSLSRYLATALLNEWPDERDANCNPRTPGCIRAAKNLARYALKNGDTMTTLNDPREPAEICRANGWTVGTRLVGDEGHGPTVIEITAIGEQCILARMLRHNELDRSRLWAIYTRESIWPLSTRDWRVVSSLGSD